MQKKSRKSFGRERYSDEIRLTVVRELLDTGVSISQLAEKYCLPPSVVYLWLSNFGVEQPKDIVKSIMSKDYASLVKELAETKRALEKSKLNAWEAKVEALAQRTLVEHLEKKYNIDIKKKTDLP